VAIIISKKPKLSTLEIDVDKDWNNKGIYHLDYLIIQPDSYPSVEFKPFRVIFGNKGYDAVYNSTVDRFGNTMEWIYHSLYADDKAFEIGIYKLTNSGGISSYMGYIDAGDIQASVSAQSFEITTLSGLDILIDNNIEVIMPTDGNVTIMGYSQNLFRVENINDAEQHVVDSIYHDDTLNLDIVGTRWAMKVNDNDYHMGIGITHDLTSGNVWSGIASTYNFGMTTTKTSPYEITGIGFGMSGYDGYVRNVDVVLDEDRNAVSIFGIRQRDASFPFLGGDYPDTINYVKFKFDTLYCKTEMYINGLWGTKLHVGYGDGYIDFYSNTQFAPNTSSFTLSGIRKVDFITLFVINGNPVTQDRYFDFNTQDVFLIYGNGSSDALALQNFGSFDLNNIPVVNVSSLTGSAVGITTTSGDITLSPAGLINLSQKQAINFVIENYNGEPLNAVTGRIIFNTQTGRFEGYNGTSWIQFGGGGGVTKLSQLEIDTDKDWAGHSITNFGNLSGSAIGITSTSGDITLSTASGNIITHGIVFGGVSPYTTSIGDTIDGNAEILLAPDINNMRAYIGITDGQNNPNLASPKNIVSIWAKSTGKIELGTDTCYLELRDFGGGIGISAPSVGISTDTGDIVLSPASGNLILHGLQSGNDPYKVIIGDTMSGDTEIDIFPDVNDWSIGIQIVNAINNPYISRRYMNIWSDTLDISTNAGIIDMGSTGSSDIYITANNNIYLNGSMINIMCETIMSNTLYMQNPLNMQNNNIININSLIGNSINITSTSGNITLNPSNAVDFSKKQSKNHVLEKWTTSTRPSNPVEGQIGYNTDTHQFEGWNGSTWVILG